MKKRIISMILLITMAVTMLPATIFAANTFTDVSEGDWFYESATYVADHNIFKGTEENRFSPNGTMTRAMFVTVLGRMADVNTAKYSGSGNFADVSPDAYYAPYVSWAVGQNITQGMGDGKFEPDGLVTREQMAAFTVRFFTAGDYTYPANIVTTTPADIDQISPYASEAVLKLWGCGLFQGDENGNFNPRNNATRAEAAAFCMRVDKVIASKGANIIINGNGGSNQNAKPKPTPTPIPSYSITYDTDGGSPLNSVSLKKGTALDNLPIPFKQGAIFAGWYYDKTLENKVLKSDVLNNPITLYAKYGDTAPLDETASAAFASALDQGTDFTVNVLNISDDSMSAADVKDGIIAKNLNSVKQSDFISVTESGGAFTISAKDGAFEAGATYKITLDDERLQFDGFGASVRDYNFTTAKEEILSLSLNEDLIYIPAADVTEMTKDGNSVSTLSVPMITVGEDLSAVKLENGTFTYDKEALEIGSTVAIYEGVAPNKRTLDDTDGDIAYVTITEKNDNTYSYKSANSENVLFTPDILPVNITADTDGDSTNHSITVAKNVMEFSDDIYTKVGLDSQTDIDNGDFIAFYSGEFGEGATDLSYAKIASVNLHDNTYTITYTDATSDDVFAAMDIYNSENVDGETLLEGTDVEALEQSVERQARDSGFADEAAQYLADTALKTESFTALSEDMKLGNVTLEKQDGTPLSNSEISLMSEDNSKVRINNLDLDAEIGTQLQHFDNVSGVRLLLKVGVEVAVDINEDSELIINVTGEFEQETRVALNISGGAVWSMWGIFPYISEYEATANIDLYDYTGIEVNATIVTKEKQTGIELDGSLKNISEELKKLLDGNDAYVGDGKGTVVDGIAAKYQALLQNESDWIQLFSQDICRTKGSIDPFHVLAYEFGLSFVVSANLNISLGIDFYYQNAKRYSYTVAVFAKSVTSDIVDVVEEQYEFTFYVMGVLGVRAGILLEAKIGLFDTDLDSVGFTAEAGAYFKVWGYFYYNLKYTASQGRSSSYAGALLLELGIYLEIKFEAQAFSGTFSYNPTLYENEWPLWHAGTQKNVQDFAYLPPAAPEIAMKKFVQTVSLPDNLFGMKYLDLKEGDIGSSIYDDTKDFEIEMTNKAFAYDPVTNYVSVTPGDAKELDGEMTIRWKSQPLAFTSAPLTRKIKLHWDNLNDGYYIAFNSNGGSTVDMIVSKYGQNIVIPSAPTRQGYVFGGWYTDEAFTQPYIVPSTMPDVDTLAYAKWIPAIDTKYTVEHYKQNLQNILYEPVEIQTLQGTTDAAVTPEHRAYEGFTTPKEEEIVIKADGSAVVRYYYSRARYTLTFSDNGEEITNKVKYGERISAPVLAKKGYDFAGWDGTVDETMPAHDLTYNALWTAKEANDIPYRVEHYLQNAENDGYTLHQIDKLTGATEDVVTSDTAMLAEKLPIGFAYYQATVGGEEATTAVVTGDGKLVFKLYYNREVHDLSFALNETADSDMPETTPYRYDKMIIEPDIPVKEGYQFIAWYTDESMTTEAVFGTLKMPNEGMTLYGKMELDLEAGFAITYNGLNGAENSNPTRYTVGDEDITLASPGERLGYSFDGWYTDSAYQNKVEGVAIPTNSIGQKRFYAKWSAVNYAITYHNMDGAVNNNPAAYQITSSDITLSEPTKPGYTFEGWFTDDALETAAQVPAIATGSTGDTAFYAKWTANTYTVIFNKNANEGTGTMQPLACTYDAETTLPSNAFGRNGYTFKCWNTKSDGSGTVFANGASIKNLADSGTASLYAMWIPTEYSIAYVLNGTNHSDNPAKYTVESPAIDLKDPTWTGHTFLGWYTDGGYNTSVSKPAIPAGSTGDLTFYAKWQLNSYTVQFLPYGDNVTGSVDSMSFYYEQSKVLNANAFERTGYTFAGWSRSAGGAIQYTDRQSVSNLTTTNNGTVTLYPVWTEHTYTLTFSADGALNPDGNFWNTKTVKYSDNITIPGDGIVNGWNYNGGVLKPGQSGVYGLTETDGETVTLMPDWKVGSGTAADPYLIRDWGTLANMKNHLSGQFKMIADVNLFATSWTPIGSYDTPFTGILDGNGHTIKNMNAYVDNTNKEDGTGAGLFDTVMAATIKNIKFVNSKANSVGWGEAGIIAGRVKPNDKETVCDKITLSSDCSVLSDGTNGTSGGIFGLLVNNSKTTIKNCSVAGTFTGAVKGYLVGQKTPNATFDGGTGNTTTTSLPPVGMID